MLINIIFPIGLNRMSVPTGHCEQIVGDRHSLLELVFRHLGYAVYQRED